VVGGGTAGWMAATLMAARWRDQGVSITLVESPEIGTIGVGEGSTPQLRSFFDAVGLAEEAWMPQCHATCKLGIRFTGWSGRPGAQSYFHPFPAQTDIHSARPFLRHCLARRAGESVPANPDDWFLNSVLSEQRRGPRAVYSFPFEVQYGYHFDSQALAQCLAQRATQLGVRRLERRVVDVLRHENGDISALRTEGDGQIDGDFFVDSTGFGGILMQKTLGVPFRSFADNLFNDAAVVFPTSYDPSFLPQTDSVAMRCGWRWRIPLGHRVGNGYVYSSAHCTADEAEEELREALGLLDSDVEARHLRMRVGQLAQHWCGNCAAVGLAQGFIEPLEATALHLVQATVESLIGALERDSFGARYRDEFNEGISSRFEGVRDYIVGHYRLTARVDTSYWRDNAHNEKLSDNLRAVIESWLRREDLTPVLKQRGMEAYYSTLSWHCMLAGYGLFPDAGRLDATRQAVGEERRRQTRDFLERCALNFAPLAGTDARGATVDAA
jgi:hypothetical protein